VGCSGQQVLSGRPALTALPLLQLVCNAMRWRPLRGLQPCSSQLITPETQEKKEEKEILELVPLDVVQLST